MCTLDCIAFGRRQVRPDEVRGRRVVEVGSYDVNGSLRSVIEPMQPAEYIGVDMVEGYGVDVICPAEDVLDLFGSERFDMVVSTELLEHVLHWQKVISTIKNLCVPGGTVLITTRSKGFVYHGWPYDFWRFEPSDMSEIFSDFAVEVIEADPGSPGVFVKARRPLEFRERDLSRFMLHSMVSETRVASIDEATLASFLARNADRYRIPERASLRRRARKILRDTYWRLLRARRPLAIART